MFGRMVKSAAFALMLFLAAGPLHAHEDNSVAGGFAAGLLHPVTGLDHLLAMVAVGLWGAFLGRPLVYVLPVLFPAVMAVGGVMGMAGVPMPPVELGIALSVLILGGFIAGARSLPVWAAAAIVAVFAIFHGYAHGQELPLAADPAEYSLGFVIATGLLHVAGIALGLLTGRKGALSKIPRAAGAGIAIAGLYFTYQALAA